MYTYLLIDLGSFIIPFIFSFHKRLQFYRHFKSFIIACLLVGIPFIIWDIVFTENGIWGFNSKYLIGVDFFGVPLEEYLFFICIPFACVFTYYSLEILWPLKEVLYTKFISIFLAIILMVIALFFHEKLYTFITFSALSLLLIFSYKWKKITLFYRSFIIIMIPFFIVNGILTGTGLDGEVVWYNELHNLNIRMGTIPVEDVFYAMLMLLPTIIIFDRLRRLRGV
jgi:lycopene cyclase domain-containing protein